MMKNESSMGNAFNTSNNLLKYADIDEIMNIIEKNSQMGKYSIINENISIHDGGVSGVVLGDIIEFCPDDTPKCVDKEGVCSLPRELGMKILKTVYGFSPESPCNIACIVSADEKSFNFGGRTQ